MEYRLLNVLVHVIEYLVAGDAEKGDPVSQLSSQEPIVSADGF